MRKPLAIARQSGEPSGLIGRVVLRFMAGETNDFNAEILAKLQISGGDRVLEVGFGHGKTLATAAAAAPTAVFAGIDVSREAVRVAEHRCRRLIAGGRVDLRLGDAAALPWATGSFTKAIAVHTLYFWDEPSRYFVELRRVLSAHGVLILGFRERSPETDARFPASIYRLYTSDQIAELLRSSGFAVEIHRADSGADLRVAVGHASSRPAAAPACRTRAGRRPRSMT